MKIAFNRKVRRGPWGGGNQFLCAMWDKLASEGHQVTSWLEDGLDVIFMMDPRHEEEGFDWTSIAAYKRKNPKTTVLHRVNECDARKGTDFMDDLLTCANTVADHTVFISAWLKGHLESKGTFRKLPNVPDVVYNGCDLNWFKPDGHELGSPVKLVTHHWSDNPMKGSDLYHALDRFVEKNPQYEFTYIGRYDRSYTPKNTKLIDPLWGADLGCEIAKHDVYVTATRQEPLGMHHVEGAACGLPVMYHADSGGVKDFVESHGHYGVEFRNAREFEEALSRIVAEHARFKSKIWREDLGIDRCCERYLRIIEAMT